MNDPLAQVMRVSPVLATYVSWLCGLSFEKERPEEASEQGSCSIAGPGEFVSQIGCFGGSEFVSQFS
jgi:hypothetical protein